MATTAETALAALSVLAIVVNCVLLTFIARDATQQLRLYKRFMAFSSCVDLSLAVVNLALVPRIVTTKYPNGTVVVAIGPAGFIG